MPSPQNVFPLSCTQGICPPLQAPPPLQLESKVSPPSSCCCSRADHVQPSQKDSGLTSHPTNRQRLSQEWSCQRNLCLLRPSLTPPSQLGSCQPHSRLCQMVDEGVKVVRSLTEGSNHNALHLAQRAQFELHWSNITLGSATVGLISPSCLCLVLGIELPCSLVDCPSGILSFPVKSVSCFWAAN